MIKRHTIIQTGAKRIEGEGGYWVWVNVSNPYSQFHGWIRKNYGPAKKCSSKKCKGESKQFEWALKKGKKHSKNIRNYKQLCKKCHAIYDKRSEKISKALKGKPFSPSHLAAVRAYHKTRKHVSQ